MKTRKKTVYWNEELIQDSLDVLANKGTRVAEYRDAFENLGKKLGEILAKKFEGIPAEETMLVCSSEDADWLTKGVQSGFNKGVLPVSVYWSTRKTIYESRDGYKVEISPIVMAYEEPINSCRLLVIVKSIISSSCVVKTQLLRLMNRVCPEKIVIMAPVMYKDGIPNLKKEFPESVSDKFCFITFAEDSERIGGEVIPGVGGLVYERLGLGNVHTKNQYIPRFVKSRVDSEEF